MPDELRFSPRPNRAADISWRAWGPAALDQAAAADRPLLLNLSAFWCHWCQRMDETTFSDPAVIRLLNEHFVPVRVDADREPHVQDRYIAGGWPTNAFLTPTGEVLWAGTYVDADQLREVADGVLAAWLERRAELETEIDRRRRALEAARRQTTALGLVRRESADDVTTVLRDTFDARNGGFGTAPKFPTPDAIELLYSAAAEDPSSAAMADQTLDGMLSGGLWDAAGGGFFRYATEADWTAPRYEKLLDINAGMLDAYSLGSLLRNRADWRQTSEAIVAWADSTLADPRTGLWGGSQAADPDYFAADPAARRELPAPPVDHTVYTNASARWIAALARAGARLGRNDWVDRADIALQALFRLVSAPGGGVFHYSTPVGAVRLDTLLADTLECACAALQLAQATGRADWLQTARRLARHLEQHFWAEDAGFWDRVPSADDIGALRYRERPFELNALAARMLLDLARITGERSWRGLAEGTLARIGPLAGRHGPGGAVFAMAAAEFYEPPPAVVIAVPGPEHEPQAADLRRSAALLPVPGLRVWTVPAGHAAGPQHFPATDSATAFLWSHRGCSAPIRSADALTAASTDAGLHA
jgi:uncharacterized protein